MKSAMLRSVRLVAVATSCAVAIALTGTGASASDPGADADQTAATVEAVAPPAEVVAPMETPGGSLVSQTSRGPVGSPANGSGDVRVAALDGLVSLTIGLPEEAAGARAQVARDGTVVYHSDGPVDLAVQAVDTGVRVQTVLADATAPTEFTYDFDGLTPILNADGSVTLTVPGDGFNVQLGSLAVPWALDANGAAVPTRFRVEGAAVIQEVDHLRAGIAYPVVADPWYKYDCGIVTCTISFDRATTRNIRDGLDLASIGTGVAGVLAGLAAVAVGVLAALIVAKLQVDRVFAARYYENGNCFAYLFPRAPIFGLASFWPKQISRGSRNCA